MKKIEIGAKGFAEIIVSISDLAVNVGSGSLDVLATPKMAMLMEKAACSCISEFLETNETTVGTELNIQHLSPTPIGMKVYAEAEIIDVNGREIVFKVTAYDESSIIGSGTHKRFAVLVDKFMAKALSKINK